MFWRKQKAVQRKNLRRQFLRVESLESRNLLSGSPWQNPVSCNDLDNDGTVTATDAVAAINAINASGAGSLSGKMTAPTLSGGSSKYLDADGDSELTASDVVSVINAINSGRTGAPPSEPLPATDQQADEISADIPALELENGFARVRAALNTAGDADVFKVTASTTVLNVALFSRTAGISVTIQDESGAEIDSATTNPTEHRPAAVHATVEAGATYFIVVTGDDDTTGEYCLQVIDSAKAPPPPGKPGAGENGGGEETEGDEGDESKHHAPPPPAPRGEDESGETDEDEEGEPHLPPPPPKPADVFAKFDANADGSLSLEEFSKLPPPKDATLTPADVFAKLDANSDGSLSLEEFMAILPKPPSDESDESEDDDAPPPPPPHDQKTPPAPANVFKHLDANADSSLSATEFAKLRLPPGVTTALDTLFASWDTDSSGLLNLTEFDLGFASFKKS